MDDEEYIIDLCDSELNRKARRQHRFDFLRGDPGKNGRCAKLPVDAYYEELKLVIEYRERQHTESVPIMDERPTCSRVPRGQQRPLYDQRRRDVLKQHDIRLLDLNYSEFAHDRRGRLLRDELADKAVIRRRLADLFPKLIETHQSSSGQ